jgi:hypothetical protein
MKNFLTIFLTLILIIPLFSQKKEEVIKIPKEVAQIMDLNLAERKNRMDIPVEFKGYLYYPSRMEENIFVIFLFKIKNDSIFSTEAEGKIFGELDTFLRFYSTDSKGIPKKVVKEVYLPLKEIAEKGNYNPEEFHYYSIIQTLNPGDYILSYSLASPDLKKISVAYTDLTLPDIIKVDKLQTTPLFFLKSLKILDTPQTEAIIQKDSFTYGRLQIEPYFENKFKGNETVELFYFILGASTSSKGTYDFEINYKVKKGDADKIKFAPQILENQRAPIISHPLPIFSEDRKLEPGDYTLQIFIKDKNSGKSFEGKIDFVVVEN